MKVPQEIVLLHKQSWNWFFIEGPPAKLHCMMKWETPLGLVQISTSRKKITPQTTKHGQEYKKGEESEGWVPIQPKGYARSSKWDPLCNNYSLLIHTANLTPKCEYYFL